jgi:hypothetical protein
VNKADTNAKSHIDVVMTSALCPVLSYDQVKPKATTLIFLLPGLAILIKEQEFIYNQYLSTVNLSLNPVHGEVYSIQHYVIKFVSDLRHVCGFLRVLWFLQPIKLTVTYN